MRIIPAVSGGRLHQELADARRHHRGNLEIRLALQVGYNVRDEAARVKARHLVSSGGRLMNRNVRDLRRDGYALERFAIALTGNDERKRLAVLFECEVNVVASGE